jgi:hypothetical protein
MINSSAQVLVGTTSVLQSTEQLAVSSSTNTAILAKFTGGATAGWGSKIWNNGATGDNNILEFLTETSITARGSVKYDRTNDALLLSGSNAFNISTNGTTAIYVTAAQKVGIGGASTTLRMTVNDTGSTITGGDVTFATQAKGLEIFNTNSATTDNLIGVWFSTGPHKAGIASGRPDASGGWATDLRFFTHPTSTTNLDHTYEKMRLTGDGSLNINNTTNATYKLSVYNNVEDTHVLVAGLAPSLRFADTVTGITYSTLFGMATVANNFITGSSAGDFAITWGSTKKCYFGYTNATAIMVLDGGNLGLGTLTVGSKAQINGNMAVGYSSSTAAPTNGILSNGGYKSSAPASASAGTWKLGTATTTSAMTQNRYITVEVDGSVYALFAQFLY